MEKHNGHKILVRKWAVVSTWCLCTALCTRSATRYNCTGVNMPRLSAMTHCNRNTSFGLLTPGPAVDLSLHLVCRLPIRARKNEHTSSQTELKALPTPAADKEILSACWASFITFFYKIVQHRFFSGEDFGHHLPNIKTFRASNVLSNTVFGVEGIVLTRRWCSSQRQWFI